MSRDLAGFARNSGETVFLKSKNQAWAGLCALLQRLDGAGSYFLGLMNKAGLSRHERIYESVDDSDGFIGEAMQQAVQLWLQVAAQLRKQQPDARQWVDAVLKYNSQNDYGCFDELISSSRCLLTENELQVLASHFEQQAQVAVCLDLGDEHYNAPLSTACLGMEAVAEALQDFSLYERSLLIQSPVPNTMQLKT